MHWLGHSNRNERMTDIEDRWLSIGEICTYLGVSNDAVYKWINQHAMPAHRMGRLWKFKKADVDQWVKDGGAAGHMSEGVGSA